MTTDGATNVNAETTDCDAERGVGDAEARNEATAGDTEAQNRNIVGGQLTDDETTPGEKTFKIYIHTNCSN